MNQTLLVKGIQIVGVLFAAFGGFLAGIAPPQVADAKFAVGLSSFLALIILFIVAALSKKKHRKAWLIAAACLFVAAVGAAYYYKASHDNLTFEYPPGSTKVEHIAGTELTELARTYKQQHAGISNSQLLAAFGGLQNKGKVWTEASVNSSRRQLIFSYMFLVLTIAAAIFAITEGALGNEPTRGAGGGTRARRQRTEPQERPADAAPSRRGNSAGGDKVEKGTDLKESDLKE